MPVFLLNWLAVALLCYSVTLVFTSNFNMGNLMVWLLSAAVGGYALWRVPLNTWFATGMGRGVWWGLVVVGVFYAAMLGFVAVAGYTNPATGQEQAVIVLGAGLHRDRPSMLLRCRLDAAYDYAVAHPDALVVTTGGQGRDEWLPEGEAMRTYLIEKGLAPDRVLAETKSTSTEENFLFAQEILAARGIAPDTSVVYVTNAFHCYRAGKYAALAGFTTARALPAGIPLRSVLPCYLREVLAVLYYWLLRTSRTGPFSGLVGLLSLNKKYFYK